MDRDSISYQGIAIRIKWYIFFTFFLSILPGQDFRDPRFNINFDNYVDILDSNLSASFHGEFSNNHSESLNIVCVVYFDDAPQDWNFTTCINTNCYSSEIDTISFLLVTNSPSDVRIDVAATTSNTGTIEIESFEEGNPEEVLHSLLTISNYITGINTALNNKNSKLIAYPNPFNNNLNIKINSEISETASVKIYNVKGEIVNNYDNIQFLSGTTIFKWSGVNSHGNEIQSGIYFISINGNSFKDFTEVLYIK